MKTISSFITDRNGYASQHLQYLPFGEPNRPLAVSSRIPLNHNTFYEQLFVEQRSTANYYTPYKFSGKEKDEETSYSYFGARYYMSDVSVWLSVDPMKDKYPNISPFNYCHWNPVMLIDPDGMEDELVITGDAADKATKQLENKTSKDFNLNRKTDGTITYSGKAKTKNDKFLQKVIDDKKISVNIEAKAENSFTWSDGSILPTENGGGFGGNSVEGDNVNTYQKVCPNMLADFDNSVGDDVSGTTMLHEVAESYFGGKIAQKIGSSPRQGLNGSSYDRAHKMANSIALGNRGAIVRNEEYLNVRWLKIGKSELPIITVHARERVVGYNRTR